MTDNRFPEGTYHHALDDFEPETPPASLNADIVDLLIRCWDYCDDHADVVDNPNGYGEVAPNAAMQLAGELRQMLAKMGHPVE